MTDSFWFSRKMPEIIRCIKQPCWRLQFHYTYSTVQNITSWEHVEYLFKNNSPWAACVLVMFENCLNSYGSRVRWINGCLSWKLVVYIKCDYYKTILSSWETPTIFKTILTRLLKTKKVSQVGAPINNYLSNS